MNSGQKKEERTSAETPGDAMTALLAVMARLRQADGCPWDREQTHSSLKRFLREETAELLDALDEGVDQAIIDELGDVLLQVIFHCRIAEEEQRFDFQTVADHCRKKLIRRHPHVFGDCQAKSAAAVREIWQEAKWEEQKNSERAPQAPLAGVPRSLPALHRAWKLQKKAAQAGGDSPSPEQSLSELERLLASTRTAITEPQRDVPREQIGKLLFTVVQLSRELGQEPEEALRQVLREYEASFPISGRTGGGNQSRFSSTELSDGTEKRKNRGRYF